MALMMTDEAGYRGLMRSVASCGAVLACSPSRPVGPCRLLIVTKYIRVNYLFLVETKAITVRICVYTRAHHTVMQMSIFSTLSTHTVEHEHSINIA